MCSVFEPEHLRLCILIPVCNEEESIPFLRERLAELQSQLRDRFRVHYLFVDDGSTDQTAELLRSAVPAGATFQIRTHAENLGIGAAFRTGFAAAESDVVCTIDADCSYAPEDLVAMIATIERGDADVVVASPYHPEGAVDGVQRWRLWLSRCCSGCYSLATPLKLFTYTSIFRAYRGSVVRAVVVPSNDFVSAVEILLSASQLGYRITEIPLTLHRRASGVSKMRIARTVRGHLGLIFSCLSAQNGGYPRLCASQGKVPVDGNYEGAGHRHRGLEAQKHLSVAPRKKGSATL